MTDTLYRMEFEYSVESGRPKIVVHHPEGVGCDLQSVIRQILDEDRVKEIADHIGGSTSLRCVFDLRKVDSSNFVVHAIQDVGLIRRQVVSGLPRIGRTDEADSRNSDTIIRNNHTRERLFEIAEFLLPRDKAENWIACAHDYYEDYAERTSQRRANVKLALEVTGLAWSRLWKPLVAIIGIPKLWDIVGKLSGK